MYYFVSNRNIYFVNSLVKYRYVVKKNKKIEINGLALKRPNRTGLPLKFDWQYHFSFLFRETTTFLLERVGNYSKHERKSIHESPSEISYTRQLLYHCKDKDYSPKLYWWLLLLPRIYIYIYIIYLISFDTEIKYEEKREWVNRDINCKNQITKCCCCNEGGY